MKQTYLDAIHAAVSGRVNPHDSRREVWQRHLMYLLRKDRRDESEMLCKYLIASEPGDYFGFEVLARVCGAPASGSPSTLSVWP